MISTGFLACIAKYLSDIVFDKENKKLTINTEQVQDYESDVLKVFSEKCSSVSEKIKNTVNNSIPKKDYFSKIDIFWSYFLTGYVFSTQVIAGDNDWFFYNSSPNNDGDTMSNYEGTDLFTDKQLDLINSKLQIIKNRLSDRGAEFIFVIAPNKSKIYYESMDKKYSYSDYSGADQLTDYLKNNGINSLYLKEELLKNKDRLPLYYKKDSHWNLVGGHLGAKVILNSLGYELNEINKDDIELVQDDRISDLVRITGLESIYNNDEEYHVIGDSVVNDDEYNGNHDKETYYCQKNPDAEFDKTVFIIGDSFRLGIVPGLSKKFSTVYVIHRDFYKKELMDKLNPDYVILEYVERYAERVINLEDLL